MEIPLSIIEQMAKHMETLLSHATIKRGNVRVDEAWRQLGKDAQRLRKRIHAHQRETKKGYSSQNELTP